MRIKTLLVGSILFLLPFAASAQTFIPSITDVSSGGVSAPMCPAFLRSLSIGSRGDEVTELQQYLAGRGYFTASTTGYYGPITAASVSKWQLAVGVVPQGNAGLGHFGPLSRAAVTRLCSIQGSGTGSTGGVGTTTATTTATSTIQQLNAPATVTLSQDGIAEVRNEQMYFTLKALTASTAKIQVTGIGCWNWFPSDTPPAVRCMIAVMPIAPQTLSVGQTYSTPNYSITLTQVSTTTATFSIAAKN